MRDASLVELGNPRKPKPSDLLDLVVDTRRGVGHALLPAVKMPREEQQGEYVRKMEIDPVKYYPTDVNRALVTTMPKVVDILEQKIKAKL